MPRKQRPPFEAAVTASPLFKIALEIRLMIYELLLIQERGISIPSDTFARRDYRRTDSAPWECSYCGLIFLSDLGCRQHLAKYHSIHTLVSLRRSPHGLLLPQVSTSLLRTCRIIRSEASPILYSKNTFHFSDPATASNFRWSTDCAQAMATQEIGIKMGSENYKHKHVTRWVTYLTKQTLSLGEDFPHLRRIIIDLDCWVGVESAGLLCSMSKGLRKKSQGLDWVLVLTLNNEEVLNYFEPLVDREEDSKDAKKEVQRHVWNKGRSDKWKDALLWWGSLGEAVPRNPRSILHQS